MLFLAGLMGMMLVGATVLVGFDTSDPDAEEDDDFRGDAGPAPTGPGAMTGSVTGADVTDDADSPPGTPQDVSGIASGTLVADWLRASGGNDQVAGDDGDDRIEGGPGDDWLLGQGGADALSGDAGADTLEGGEGDDRLHGGPGADELNGMMGDDDLDGDAGPDTLRGGAGADTLSGGAGDDALHGNDGDDRLDGGAGQDTLFGGAGNDLLSGRDADPDYLNGGAGDDTIAAGPGDILSGDEGADVMMFGPWPGDGPPAEVTDFDPAEDRLVIGYDDAPGAVPEVEVVSAGGTAGWHHVLVAGRLIAQVHSSDGLSEDDVLLVAQRGPDPA